MQILRKLNARVRERDDTEIYSVFAFFLALPTCNLQWFPLGPALFLLFDKYLQEFIQSLIHNNVEKNKISYIDLDLYTT